MKILREWEKTIVKVEDKNNTEWYVLFLVNSCNCKCCGSRRIWYGRDSLTRCIS
jgi:hypothetical protein